MPCYLFTYHAFGTWLPGRQRGYVKRGQGVLPPNGHMHRLYAMAMKDTPVELEDEHQRHAIAVLIESQPLQHFDLHYVATEPTHIHVLSSWRDVRDAVKLRGLVKGSLSRSFNKGYHRREWFAEGGSRKQVRDRLHFEHLVTTYLPRHAGWKWSRVRGLFQ
jgi:REP element-mobilizing transposase RayT